MHIDALTFANAIAGVIGGTVALVAKRDRIVRAGKRDWLVLLRTVAGVVLVALGVINLWRVRDHFTDLVRLNALWGVSMWVLLGASVLLGLVAGARWITALRGRGDRVAPWLGALAIVGGLVVILFELRILKYL